MFRQGNILSKYFCNFEIYNIIRFFKMQEFLDLFQTYQRNQRQLEKQMLCCFISMFAKTVDVYYIFGNIDHFRSF